MQATRFAKILVAGIAAWVIPATAFCDAVKPAVLMEALASEEFREREEAQARLEAWANAEPALAMEFLFTEYEKKTTDPEARLRIRETLRQLAVDEHQRNHGEGYVGIRMMELPVAIPGDDQPRMGVQITDVVPDSPAKQAGLELGDVVVSLEGVRWSAPGTPEAFSSVVRKMKPRDKVKLEILRRGELKKLEVELGTRPLGMPERPPLLFLQNGRVVPEPVPEDTEEKAREEVFRTWLGEQRAKRRMP